MLILHTISGMLDSTNFDFEVAIVGASVTGASLAHALGRAGIKVALIDKQSFPRRKPCGEGLSGLARPHLKNLGLLETIASITQQKLTHYLIDFRGLKIPIPCIGKNQGDSIGIDRSILDRAINELATQNHSVVQILNEKVSDISEELGVLFSSGRRLKARFIVVAAGINHPFKNRIRYSEGFNRYGLSIHAKVPPAKITNRVEIFLRSDLQIFVTPTGPEEINISALGSKSEIKELASANMQPAIKLISDAWGSPILPTTEILGAGPFGRKAERRIIGNIILAGDSYEALDPIGGMGMTQGFMSADYLSQNLINICRQKADCVEALQRYEQEIERSTFALRAFSNFVRFSLDSCAGKIAGPLTRPEPRPIIQVA